MALVTQFTVLCDNCGAYTHVNRNDVRDKSAVRAYVKNEGWDHLDKKDLCSSCLKYLQEHGETPSMSLLPNAVKEAQET